MALKDKNIQTGVVEEALPNTTFRIRLKDGNTVLGFLSGKMRKYYIKVLVGDEVTMEFSPYDDSKGRIVKRH